MDYSYETTCSIFEEKFKDLANRPATPERDYAVDVLANVADRFGMEMFGVIGDDERIRPADEIQVIGR